MEAEHKDKVTLAYANALWTAQWMGGKKKPPTLESLLNQKEPKKKMTDNEMLKKVKMLNAIFGGEVKEDGK